MPFGRAITEGDIRDVCFEYLQKRGHLVFRDKQNPGKTRLMFPESKGVSDILGIVKGNGGRMFAIEVKKPGGTLSVEQHRFLEEVTRMGGLAIVATDLDCVKAKGL